jgi:hypothetical protein
MQSASAAAAGGLDDADMMEEAGAPGEGDSNTNN